MAESWTLFPCSSTLLVEYYTTKKNLIEIDDPQFVYSPCKSKYYLIYRSFSQNAVEVPQHYGFTSFLM